MKRMILTIFLTFGFYSFVRADSTWILDSSLLAYHVDHAFHKTLGKTAAARGKGICGKDGCDFLVAAPVKSFESGDENRDLHMIQAVNGGTHPLVSVKVHLPSEPTAAGFTADLAVDFAGREVVYPKVAFQVTEVTPQHFKAKGQVPLLLSNHPVQKPSLLGVAIKDSAPVDVETTWVKK